MDQTHLGLSMDSLESAKLKYDSNIKELLADVQVLSRLVKHVVEEARGLELNEIINCIENVHVGKIPTEPGLTNYGKIESVQTENHIPNEGKVTFDIRFELCIKDFRIKLIINVEAQKSTDYSSLHYHLENRIVYYLARLISSQKNKEFYKSDYDAIKKVYSIWLCMDASEDEDSIHKIQLTNQIVYGNHIVLEELDKMCAIVIRLRKSNRVEESKDTLISMLEELLSNKDKEEKKQNLIMKYGLKMTTQIERRLSIMCNYSDIVEERGIERHRVECVCKKLRKGKTIELIAEELEEEKIVIEKICEIAKNYSPEYDVEKILKAVQDK